MGKTKIKIISFIAFCLMGVTVLAISITDKVGASLTSSKDKLKEEETVIVELKFDNYNNITKGLNAFKATLEYDDEIFKQVQQSDFVAKSDWEELKYNKDTKEFVAIKKAGSKSDENIVQISLTVKKDIESGKTEVGIGNIVTSEGKEDLYLNDTSVQIDIIKDQEEKPEEPDVPAEIESEKYVIEEGYISKVLPKTTVQKFKENVASKGKVVFTDEAGNVLSDDSPIKTGTIIKIGEKLQYSIVVTGDVNKDGELDIDDLAEMKFHIIETKQLSGIKFKAADIDTDKDITIDDIAKMKLIIIGKIKLDN